MRIVVTGRNGQVACSLAQRGRERGLEIVLLGRPELDLAGSSETIVAALEAAHPEVIVSAAAYTAVDKAETERDLAFAVNERGPRAIARAARHLNVPLIHLSTDYVFDGLKSSPYVEDDPTEPTGVYGASKLAGERAVLEQHEDSAVLRTAWVYSPFGSNFVKTMHRLAGERDEINVVADQQGNPTSALDIADGILDVAANLRKSSNPAMRGVFHMVGEGQASWAEFAETIFAISAQLGLPSAKVRPITTADYPTAARRPANSRLDPGRIARQHGVRLPDWNASLKVVVERLLKTQS